MKFIPYDILLKALTVAALFFAPLYSIMWAVTVLIIVDCFTGVWASRIKRIPFSSSKFFSSITKLVVYIILIIISYIVEVNLIPEIPLLKLSVFFIAVTEFISFAENVTIISGRDIVGFFREQFGKLKPFSNKHDDKAEPEQ